MIKKLGELFNHFIKLFTYVLKSFIGWIKGRYRLSEPFKIEIARDTLPNKELYKFRPLSSDEMLSRVEDILLANELYFPSPNELNDPHECRPKIVVDDLDDPVCKKRYIDYTLEIKRRTNPYITREQVEADLDRQTPEEREEVAKGATDNFRKGIIKKYRICCFCASATNPLLWSHYADSHKGICLVFDIENDTFLGKKKVDYQDEYQTFNITMQNHEEVMRQSVLTKYTDWKYEEEYRLISMEPDGATGLPLKNKKFIFPSEMLRAVIFGCRMSDWHKELIKGWCEKRENKVEFRQAKLSETVYELDIVPLSSI